MDENFTGLTIELGDSYVTDTSFCAGCRKSYHIESLSSVDAELLILVCPECFRIVNNLGLMPESWDV